MPGNIYVGSCEIFAGALISVIGIAYPAVIPLGMAIMADGGSRFLDGLSQLSDEQRKDPNSPKLKSAWI